MVGPLVLGGRCRPDGPHGAGGATDADGGDEHDQERCDEDAEAQDDTHASV